MVGCGRTLCRLIPISIHERIFNNKDSLGEDIVSTMALRIAKGHALEKNVQASQSIISCITGGLV